MHFKDICRQIVKNTFEEQQIQVQVNNKIEKRIRSKWDNRYKSLKKQKHATLKSADEFMAGKFILRWIRRAKVSVQNRKYQEEQNDKYDI